MFTDLRQGVTAFKSLLVEKKRFGKNGGKLAALFKVSPSGCDVISDFRFVLW